MFWSMCPGFARPSGACWGLRCHLAFENTAIYCTAATGAGKMAALARSVSHERSNGLLEPPLGAPKAFEGAARAPARCPRTLEVAAQASARCPSALQIAARAPARCPRNAQSGISSPYSVPQKRSSLLLCHRAFKKAFEEAVRRNGARPH